MIVERGVYAVKLYNKISVKGIAAQPKLHLTCFVGGQAAKISNLNSQFTIVGIAPPQAGE